MLLGEFRSGNRVSSLPFFILLVSLSAAFAPTTVHAGQTDGVWIDWVAVFAGAGHGNDYALDMAVTASDFIHPAGFSFDATSDDAYLTLKYDVEGTLLWDKRLSSTGSDEDKVNAVTVDESENVFVTGFMTAIGGDKNIVTVKYRPSGSLAWLRTYSGADGLDDEGLDIETDGAGNVYVTGYIRSVSSGYDYFTIKYNSGGSLQWADLYSGLLNWEDRAQAIAVAENGTAWVTGGSEGLGTGQDYLTIQYDADGNRDWTRRNNGPGVGDDVAYDVFQSGGGAYVTGSAVAASGETAITTIRYDGQGNLQWKAEYKSPSNDGAVGRAVMVNEEDHVYVVGYVFIGSASETDYVTLKYDENGDELWHQYYDSPRDPSLDEAAAMAFDPAGNLYVTGYAQGESGDYDYVTVEYDPDGNNLWSARYDGDEEGNDVATSIVTDSSGNVYVSGYSWGGPGELYDLVTVKYCRGCLIGGVCYDDGEENPANICLLCDASLAETAWSDNDGVACDDGQFCNGDDYCQAGSCTIHTGDPCDDDGLFCNGGEFCDEGGDQCLHSGNPCSDDGLFCNGDELCDEQGDQCVHTGDPCGDDGLFCTGGEYCDETNDVCGHTGDPCADDGLYCNGAESCDEEDDECVSAGDPCADDGLYCNGEESCDEEKDQCVSSGDPCAEDGVFCNGVESCNEEEDGCVSSGDPCVDDGIFCNGAESCDEKDDACVSAGDPCGDNGLFCDGDEYCDETNDACGHTGSPCVDDGLFCNGEESCDEEKDACVSSGDPCEPGSVCDEEEGACSPGDDSDDEPISDEEEGGEASGGACCTC